MTRQFVLSGTCSKDNWPKSVRVNATFTLQDEDLERYLAWSWENSGGPMVKFQAMLRKLDYEQAEKFASAEHDARIILDGVKTVRTKIVPLSEQPLMEQLRQVIQAAKSGSSVINLKMAEEMVENAAGREQITTEQYDELTSLML